MASLWLPPTWPQRLDELLTPAPDLKATPLRRDVRSLGMLLGQVLREQAEPGVYETVEALRLSAIARREQEADFPSIATEAADTLRAYQLARAFSFYFELINLAETNHRKRRRLAHQLESPANVQRGSFQGTLRALKQAGIGREQALSPARRNLRHAGVYRAPHRGRTALRHVQAPPHFRPSGRARPHPLARSRARRPRTNPARRDHRALADRRRTQRAPHRARRNPHGARLLRSRRLFDTLPVLYGEVAQGARCSSTRKVRASPLVAEAALPLLVSFGSAGLAAIATAIPFVTPETTAEALAMARGHAVRATTSARLENALRAARKLHAAGRRCRQALAEKLEPPIWMRSASRGTGLAGAAIAGGPLPA